MRFVKRGIRSWSSLGFVLAALSFIQSTRSRLSIGTEWRGFNDTLEELNADHRRLEWRGSDDVLEELNDGHRRLTPCKPQSLLALDGSVKTETVVNFIAMGDVPYSRLERYCLNHQLRKIDLSSKPGPSFMIHVGDIRPNDKLSPCNKESFNDVAEIFTNASNALNYDPRDLFFVPGDNEWRACSSPNNAWKLWMEHFGPRNKYGFGTFSSRGVTVRRQKNVERLPGVDRSENFSFMKNKVLFIGLNIIGGDAIGDERIRLAQNLKWARQELSFHSRKGMKAAVFFAHAPIDKGVRFKYFGKRFFFLLRKEYRDLPVMYLRGDSHRYCLKQPDPKNSNLFDVTVEEGGDAPPMLVSVIRRPADNSYTFAIDRRGGPYADTRRGRCPVVKEQTWNSPELDPSIPVLRYRGSYSNSDDRDKFPLGLCKGDCDRDSECLPGLKCFKRDNFSPIPGCNLYGTRHKDYCIRPSSALPKLTDLGARPPKTALPLDACTGDCDRDRDCKSGLYCFMRDGREPVPGCSTTSLGRKGRNYCYRPFAPPLPTNVTLEPPLTTNITLVGNQSGIP